MTNEEFEPIRIRIMQEAYDLADRNDTEGFNAVKVMCGEVQKLIHIPPQRTWVGLTDEDIKDIVGCNDSDSNDVYKHLVEKLANRCKAMFQQIEAKLKDKNT